MHDGDCNFKHIIGDPFPCSIS